VDSNTEIVDTDISFDILSNLKLDELIDTPFEIQQDIFDAVKKFSVRYRIEEDDQKYLPDERTLVDVLNQLVIKSMNLELQEFESLIGYSIAHSIIISNNIHNYKFFASENFCFNHDEANFHRRNILTNINEILYSETPLMFCQSIINSINELTPDPIEYYFANFLYQEIQDLKGIQALQEFQKSEDN